MNPGTINCLITVNIDRINQWETFFYAYNFVGKRRFRVSWFLFIKQLGFRLNIVLIIRKLFGKRRPTGKKIF